MGSLRDIRYYWAGKFGRVIPGNLQGNVVETVRRVHRGGPFK